MDVRVLAPWVASSSVVAVATVGAGLAGSEVGTLTVTVIKRPPARTAPQPPRAACVRCAVVCGHAAVNVRYVALLRVLWVCIRAVLDCVVWEVPPSCALSVVSRVCVMSLLKPVDAHNVVRPHAPACQMSVRKGRRGGLFAGMPYVSPLTPSRVALDRHGGGGAGAAARPSAPPSTHSRGLTRASAS